MKSEAGFREKCVGESWSVDTFWQKGRVRGEIRYVMQVVKACPQRGRRQIKGTKCRCQLWQREVLGEPGGEEHVSVVLWSAGCIPVGSPTDQRLWAGRLPDAIGLGVKAVVQEPRCWVQALTLPLTSCVTSTDKGG